ncbi:MAG: ExeA family protein [Gammaproteobacteria bacterium]
MYYASFGLKQPPFRITPDTRLFFPGGNRGAVLEALVYAVATGEGIVKVVGEVGSGKTMLCRMLEVELPKNVEIVYLANPRLAPEHILHAIAFELKLPVQTEDDRLKVMHCLHEYLLRKHAENRRTVAFVEEAQGMPIETLEEIRLLSNLETQHEKLLQIVLFGQPELDESLANRRIRQLKERITYSFYLQPFSVPQVRDYLNSRLRANGYKGDALFTEAAVRAITRYSKGLLRRINILADKALLAAYADNALKVQAKHVRRAARDSEFADTDRSYGRRVVLASVLAIAAGLSAWLGYHYAQRSPPGPSPTEADTRGPLAGAIAAEPAVPTAPPRAERPTRGRAASKRSGQDQR